MLRDKIYWISAAGVSYPLSGEETREVLQGRTGFVMPPAEYSEYVLPLQAGSILRQVQFRARTVTIPLILTQSSRYLLLQDMKLLSSAFDPTKGKGRIRVAISNDSNIATTYDLNCIYTGGFEGDMSAEGGGLTYSKFVATFRAFDPYWYSGESIGYFFGSNPNVSFFSGNTGGYFLPLHVGSSGNVGSAVSVNNTGDVDSWPVWTIYGPGTNPTFTNATSGKFLTLATTLSATEKVVVDTREGVKTVLKYTLTAGTQGSSGTYATTGTNLFSSIFAGSSLWSFPTGTSSITVTMDSGTPGVSSVLVTSGLRYLSV